MQKPSQDAGKNTGGNWKLYALFAVVLLCFIRMTLNYFTTGHFTF